MASLRSRSLAVAGILALDLPAGIARADGTDQKIVASDAAANDQFGRSVAVSEATMVVGAWGADDDGADGGSADVYVRCRGFLVDQAKLSAADAAADDQFGWSVAEERYGSTESGQTPQHA